MSSLTNKVLEAFLDLPELAQETETRMKELHPNLWSLSLEERTESSDYWDAVTKIHVTIIGEMIFDMNAHK